MDWCGTAQPVGLAALALIDQVFAAWHEPHDDQAGRARLAATMAPIQASFRTLLEAGTTNPAGKTAGLCRALLKLWPALWTFVTVPGIEPTNNAAERAIRPAVLWRRGSFGSQSDDGVHFVERMLTVTATCTQQERSLLDYLTAVCAAVQHGRPIPALLPSLLNSQRSNSCSKRPNNARERLPIRQRTTECRSGRSDKFDSRRGYMPRVGQNPMRWLAETHRPERVTAMTIVHIPFLDGYWAESLDVLKLCLQSMRDHTSVPFDLMVFDNGSCLEVRESLADFHRRGCIQYLVLSQHNVGKLGAWNLLFSAAQSEVIAYSDSDVYFLPGWLEASLDVLKAFPEAGMVTAQPIPGDLSLHCVSTLEASANDPSITLQRGESLIPEQYVHAHRRSVGESPEDYRHRIANRKDALLTRAGVAAFVSASHFQFTSTKKVLQSLVPCQGKGPLDDTIFDDVMDSAGFWRLSTPEYLVHHMGNRLPSLETELPFLPPERAFRGTATKPQHPRKNRIVGNVVVRHILKRLNAISYELLYGA